MFVQNVPFSLCVRDLYCVLVCWWVWTCACLHLLVGPSVCLCMCRNERLSWADGCQRQKQPQPPPPSLHFHMALGSLAWMVATGVALDHLGGYWMAMAAFCNNLARSKFIRVKFGPVCRTVVPTAFGPAALHRTRLSCGVILLDPERAISGCLWWWLCSPVSHTDSCLWMIWAITLFT